MKTTIQKNLATIVQIAFKSNNAEFARHLVISPQQLNNYISGKHGIGNTMRRRLIESGISPQWIENSTGSMFLENKAGKKLIDNIEDFAQYERLENSNFETNSETLAINISKISDATIKVQFQLASFNGNSNHLSEESTATKIFFPDVKASYLMSVTGNGMLASGIIKNDIIVVNTDFNDLKDASIVCAYYDGIYIIRNWIKKDDGNYLESSKYMKPIEFIQTDKLYIFGLVESLFRNLHT